MSGVYVLDEFEEKEIKKLLDEVDNFQTIDLVGLSHRISVLTKAIRKLLEALPVEYVR